MKPTHLYLIISLLVFSFNNISCLDNEDKDKHEIIQITVASETVEALKKTFQENEPQLTECIQVKINDNDKWENWSPLSINGFTYEDGYEYKLKIKKTTLSNPPADDSSIVYNLIEVMSKEKKGNIVYAERFLVIKHDAAITGDMTNDKKDMLKEQILSSIPIPPHSKYKFLYTNLHTPKGKITIYSGKTKQEGIFERKSEKSDFNTSYYIYDIIIDNKPYKYILTTYTGSLSKSPGKYNTGAFAQDITQLYTDDYPKLEKALALQVIEKIQF